MTAARKARGAARGDFLLFAAALVLLGPAGAGGAAASEYADRRAAEVRRCEAIPRSEHQTGLALNPNGYRSFYVRSECFQKAAVTYRDASLCARVERRWSLFWSSWGYSASQCRRLVADGLAADEAALREIRRGYLEGAVTLRDFRVERNGNRRDFDIIPMLDAGFARGYSLRFDFEGVEAAGGSALLAAWGSNLKGGESIRIFVPQAEIRQHFPGFEPGRRYRIRATLTLDVGHGGQAGIWSEAFVERVFPAALRSQSLLREVAF